MKYSFLKTRNNSDMFVCYFGGVLLFLMILIPAYNMNIKIIMFFLLLCLVLVSHIGNNKSFLVSKSVFTWFVIYIGSSIFSTMISILNGNDAAFALFNVNVIEPFLMMFIICSIKPKHFKYICNIFMFSVIVVEIYNILFTMSINNIIIPANFSSNFIGMYGNIGGVSFGIIKFGSQNISWLIYLIPMYFGLILIKNEFSRKNNTVMIIIFILGVINAILCLRTAFILCIAMTPLLVLFYGRICSITIDKNRLIIIGLFFAVALLFFLYYEDFNFIINKMIEKVLVSFSTKSFINDLNIIDNSGVIRVNQIKDLLKTWSMKPIFGWGDSANSLQIVRSDVSGAYEMTYFALLMQRGIIGFTVYLVQIIWIINNCIKIVKKRKEFTYETFGILIGFTTFLFANGTNPYLQSFDRLIILFLPLSIINMNNKKELGELNLCVE